MMQEKVGIIRTGDLLNEALTDLSDLAERGKHTSPGGGRIYNPGWHQALEIDAMVDISRMCALAALAREESRGAHTRDDFPVPDRSVWGKVNSVVWKGEADEMEIRHESYPTMPEGLSNLLDASDLNEEE